MQQQHHRDATMGKETETLCRLVANHLHLAQFEPLRGVLLALRTRNRDLTRHILQSIVDGSAQFPNIAWSSSCSSPALLTYLSTLELLQLDDASSVWNFDSESLRLRAEFLVLVQHLIDFVSEKEENDDDEVKLCTRVLDRVLELGFKRLRVDENGEIENEIEISVSLIEEIELMSLRKLVLYCADVFEALSENIEKQIRQCDLEDNGLEVNVKGGDDDLKEDVDVKVLFGIQKMAQVVHLNAIRESLEGGDVEGAISHIRFLHFGYGLDQSEYRYVPF
jgi:zinc finger FYVE domain-containing protein 26